MRFVHAWDILTDFVIYKVFEIIVISPTLTVLSTDVFCRNTGLGQFRNGEQKCMPEITLQGKTWNSFRWVLERCVLRLRNNVCDYKGVLGGVLEVCHFKNHSVEQGHHVQFSSSLEIALTFSQPNKDGHPLTPTRNIVVIKFWPLETSRIRTLRWQLSAAVIKIFLR